MSVTRNLATTGSTSIIDSVPPFNDLDMHDTVKMICSNCH